jgi:hypothetical protein
MNQTQTFGGQMFKRFLAKGWTIKFTSEYQDRVSVTPPDSFGATHLFGIYIPVLRHTWQPEMHREWYAAVYDKNSKQVHGPVFEAQAIPDDTERFAAFATWISELINEPQKFTK